jgi:hypothetical protein
MLTWLLSDYLRSTRHQVITEMEALINSMIGKIRFDYNMTDDAEDRLCAGGKLAEIAAHYMNTDVGGRLADSFDQDLPISALYYELKDALPSACGIETLNQGQNFFLADCSRPKCKLEYEELLEAFAKAYRAPRALSEDLGGFLRWFN